MNIFIFSYNMNIYKNWIKSSKKIIALEASFVHRINPRANQLKFVNSIEFDHRAGEWLVLPAGHQLMELF